MESASPGFVASATACGVTTSRRRSVLRTPLGQIWFAIQKDRPVPRTWPFTPTDLMPRFREPVVSTIKMPAGSPRLTCSITAAEGNDGGEDDVYSVMTTTFVPKDEL